MLQNDYTAFKKTAKETKFIIILRQSQTTLAYAFLKFSKYPLVCMILPTLIFRTLLRVVLSELNLKNLIKFR